MEKLPSMGKTLLENYVNLIIADVDYYILVYNLCT